MIEASKLRREAPGLALLALALVFNAIMLAPEIRIEHVLVSDLAFHRAAAERLGEGIAHGEPFLEPWVSQFALGYPLWRTYQPLPHLVAAGWMAAARPLASPPESFAFLYYLLLVFTPAAIYLGARLLGLEPLASGIAAILLYAPSEAGDFGRFGVSYGAFVWRGTGLYTQLFAFDLMLPALGLAARAINSGRSRIAAAIALAATALSHLIFGYVAFLSVAVIAIVSSPPDRAKRLMRAATIIALALVLIAWFVVPLMLVSGEVNRGHWDDFTKFDSWGAPIILRALLSGTLLDFGRLPALSIAMLVAVSTALLNLRDVVGRRLLILTGVWLVLFFGRATWGHLIGLIGITNQFHLHRLQAAFELFAIMLIGWALARIIHLALASGGALAIGVGIAIGVAAIVIGAERVDYLSWNSKWGEDNLAAIQSQQKDIDATLNDVRAILAVRPGRVSAGTLAGWGDTFKVEWTKFYALLCAAHLDQLTFTYHTFSHGSDLMQVRDEGNPSSDWLFGLRAIVTPRNFKAPPGWQFYSSHGNFSVWQIPDNGYFGVADMGARYDGSMSHAMDPQVKWMASPIVKAGDLIALDSRVTRVPSFTGYDGMPPPPSVQPPGKVVFESNTGEVYRAKVLATRPTFAFLKITYFPGLRATVGSQPAPIYRVFPDFCAVPIPVGSSIVQVSYQPGLLKPILFVLGIVAVGLFAIASKQPWYAAAEDRVTERIAAAEALFASERVRAALALGFLIILFTRPLLRGQLIGGIDAVAYPPRVIEIDQSLRHQFPPLWAPDLSSGHGQPLFEFSPPLLYFAALPLFRLGFSLSDSLQLALAMMFALGAIAIYRIARGWGGSRHAAVATAGLWLFAPYLCLDVYVRAAFAESAGVAMMPVALLGVMRAIEHRSILAIALGAIGVSLVMLAHNAVALFFVPILGLLVVTRSMVGRSIAPLVAGSLAIGGGLGLSAFLWLPAFWEKGLVKTDELLTGYFDWHIHIIDPIQLLWGKWGFGLSVAGPHDGISFALGLPHIALGILGLFAALRYAKKRERSDAILFSVMALFFALLATEWTAPIWARIHTIQYLQFPWRSLFIPSLMLPLLAFFAFQRMSWRVAAAVLALVIVVNISHTEPNNYLVFDDAYFYPNWIARIGINTTSREEYEPRWVGPRPPYSAANLWSDNSAASVTELHDRLSMQSFDVSAQRPSKLYDSVFYYPGWVMNVDRREVPIAPTPGSGLITFDIPAGAHEVALEYRPTPVRRAANLISAASVALVLPGLIFGFWRREGKKAERAKTGSARSTGKQ